MSRNQFDASPDPRREEAVARRLGDALRRLTPPDQGGCLEAERIAAYQQRTLTPEETALCESHFAACARCREVLTLLAAAEGAALSDSQAPAEVPTATPPRARFSWRPLWLVPALATTAALVLWFGSRTRSVEHGNQPSLIAEAPRAESSPQVGAELQAPPAAAFSQAPAAGAASSARSIEPKRAPSGPSAGASSSPVPPAPPSYETAPQPASDAAAAQAGSSESRTQTAAPSSPSPAAEPPSTASGSVAQPANPPAPEIRAMRQAPLATPAFSAAARTTGVIVRAPDLSLGLLKPLSSSYVSWTAGAGGSIEKSSDGGRTWQMQESPLSEDWLAGSAVSSAVCWLVGRNGAIARTDDGEHWQQIPPPLMAADASGKQPDWLTVTAQNAQSAIIASANQKYLTRDAGKTWQPQP